MTHVTMERGIRPVGNVRDETVFDRIDMDIIDMTRKVVFITYRVFPVTVLPNPVLASWIRNERRPFGNDGAGEMGFYAAPAIGVVGIVLRQTEDRV